MTTSGGGHRAVDAVVAVAEERPPAAPDLDAADFVRQYYERVPDEDLVVTRPADLCAAALAHRRAAAVRPAGTAVVQVGNPDPDADGWQSRHTVIDIVTDDMPFLVDSVTMALGTRNL